MNKYVPINKRSKKQQRSYFSKQRNTWGELNPVTRIVPNGKAYNRKVIKHGDKKRMSEFDGQE